MSQAADVTSGNVRRQTGENPDGTTTELTYFEPTEETMRVLADILFKEHWADITVGPCIKGAVFEIRFKAAQGLAPRRLPYGGPGSLALSPLHR